MSLELAVDALSAHEVSQCINKDIYTDIRSDKISMKQTCKMTELNYSEIFSTSLKIQTH